MCDQVVNGLFPTDNATLLRLASLRIQYLEGDYEPGAVMYVFVTFIFIFLLL